MKKLILVSSLLALSAFGIDERLEKAMKYGPQPLKDLLAMHLRTYPDSFSHPSIFFMPFLDRTVGMQAELIRRLGRMPNYHKDMEKRGGMYDVSIRVTQAYEITAREFDREPLDRLAKLIQELLATTPKEKLLDTLAKSIAQKFTKLPKRKFWWSWKEDEEEKAWSDFDKSLIAYVMISGLTKHGTSFEALEKLELQEGNIDYLSEEELWKPALEKIITLLDKKKTFLENAESILKDGYKDLKGAGGTLKFNIPVGEEIFLTEVHPDLAILRGFVGNDCSTDVSFGFPYSPFERNYYVTDKNHRFLGYAALSIVKARGKSAIFFHTIAGPEITQAQTDMILRGVLAARQKIGGENMFLPMDHRIGENINFMAIDEIMRRSVKDSPPEPMEWLDREYREVIIATGSSHFYDHPDRNDLGRPLNSSIDNLAVEVKERPFISPLTGEAKIETKVNCRDAFRSEAFLD